jgi:cytoskeleton protein RodZ
LAVPVDAPLAPSAASAPAVEVVHSVPGADGSASAAMDTARGLAVLRATDATWVEVVDAGGQVLVQRLLQPGESLGLNGTLPFKLKIGNAAATQLQFRGESVDLAPATRDNVARLELK